MPRLRVWLLLPCAIFLLTPLLPGDVIYLKNGGKITAGVTKEDEKQVYYEVGGGEFTLPRSAVDHVEKGNAPGTASPPSPILPAAGTPLPLVPSAIPAVLEATGPDGPVDEAHLAQLVDDAVHTPTPDNLLRLKQGFQAAALFLIRTGNPEAAITKYREALKYLPHDYALTLALGYSLWKQEHYLEAIDLLRPERDRHPTSPDYPMLLGYAYYGAENLDQAITEWNRALAIKDNPNLREVLSRAEREREVAGAYSELRSEHFLLRYDSRENEALSGQVLRNLEATFAELVLDLDYSPTEAIVVILYPHQAFRDITRTPGWVGALNDGKIRVPASGLTQLTSGLARVLKHEMTHSFVRQSTLGRCPTWFNEGLAQLEEGATTAARGSELARALAGGKVPPLASLEGSFVSLPLDQVPLAYAMSLATLEYLRDAFGMGEVRRMLRAMASADFTAILAGEIRMNYSSLEEEVARSVARKYGQ